MTALAALVGCSTDDVSDGSEAPGTAEGAARGGRPSSGMFSVPTVDAPADSPLHDGRASVCVNTSWPGDCDSVLAGGYRSIHVPLDGSITIEKQGYVFDASAIDAMRTDHAQEGQGGDIKLALASPGVGCDVGPDGFTMVAPMSRFWDTVELTDASGGTDGPLTRMSWGKTGDAVATFDDGDCLQERSPADLTMLLRLPLIGPSNTTRNEFITLSTVPGNGHLLAPIVLTNDEPQAGTLDFVFAIDTTGSMWDDIGAVKSSSVELVDTLFNEVPEVRVAVIDYKDIPQSPYGGQGDYPFRVVVDFSTDRDQIVAGILGLTANGGADEPESVYSALMGVFEGHTDHLGHSLAAWRPDADKAVLLLGDAPPHDPEPVTGYTLQSVRDAAAALGTPLPGIPTAKGMSYAGAGVSGGGASIYTLQIGNDDAARTYFEALSAATGGQSFTAASAGDVVPTMMQAIGVISDDTPPANRPPVTRWATPSVARLDPPSHQMIGVDIIGVVDPEGGPVTVEITGITQDEPVSGPGSMSPDASGVGAAAASLRAERAGNGNGRVYRIAFTARDAQGAETSGAVMVCVPHGQGQNEVCPDDGQVHDATAP